jgi:hypothetical protein
MYFAEADLEVHDTNVYGVCMATKDALPQEELAMTLWVCFRHWDYRGELVQPGIAVGWWVTEMSISHWRCPKEKTIGNG